MNKVTSYWPRETNVLIEEPSSLLSYFKICEIRFYNQADTVVSSSKLIYCYLN